MAVMNVNPTRMELSLLKRRLNTALRGHRLLKDKRDELMRQFMGLIRENRSLRIEVEAALKEVNDHISIARSVMQEEQFREALLLPKQDLSLDLDEKNVMSVMIPVYKPTFKSADSGDIYSYGYAFTSCDLDEAIAQLSEILPKLLRLAEIEKSCQLMAAEIEKTRRRVNALEHVLIPRYTDTIRYISMKLEENERGTITRLMKVKDMMLQEAHGYDQPF